MGKRHMQPGDIGLDVKEKRKKDRFQLEMYKYRGGGGFLKNAFTNILQQKNECLKRDFENR